MAAALVVSTFTGTPAALAAAPQTVPYLINFQGRLTDNNGNVMANGSYNVKFRFFTVATGGSNVWEEDHVYGASDNRVSVQNGLFDLQLGTLTSISPSLFNLASQGSLYLEVELPTPATASCASNGCASWTEGAMTPRQPLSSSAYSFNSQTLDGLDSTAFAQVAAANTFSNSAAITLSGTPISGGSLLQVGSALSSGSTSGTLIGANTSIAGDLLNLQVSSATKLKVDNAGNLTLAAGATLAVGASTGSSAACSSGQYLQSQTTTGGVVTGGTCTTLSSVFANTTLTNLGTTAINASLVPGADNSISLGSAAAVWANAYTALVDSGTTTTTLGIGTTNATTITIGKSGTATNLNGGTITVAGTSTTFATLTLTDTHFQATQTTAPTIGTPTGCGNTGAAGAVTAGSTDSAGSYTITVASNGTPTTCSTVITFNKAYATPPKAIILTPTSAVGAATAVIPGQVTAVGTTTFTVALTGTPAASAKYSFYYWVIE